MKNGLKWIIPGILLPVLCFGTAYVLITHDQSQPAPEIAVNQPAAAGGLVWYTSIPQLHAERISNAFKAETGIEVNFVRDATFTIRDRLLSEIANGGTDADVVTIADIGTYTELKNNGLLMKYDSPHYGFYGDEYKDADYWAVFAAFGICMAYNDNRLDAPPQHWADLLDERWKGRIGLEDISTAGSQYGQYYMLREELGVDFWERLLSVQQPKIYYRTEDLADALLEGEIDVAGEFSIHTVYAYRVKRGASIQGIYPDEGIPLVVNPTAIMGRTDRPEEARTFSDFLLSLQGQELMQRLNYKYSVREDISPLEGLPPFSSLNVLQPADVDDYAEKRDVYIREFNGFLEAAR
jgi:iron(III) transport system substrate-binding protein